MAIPTAIADLLAKNHPLVPSAERSQYSETREIWSYNSGTSGEENPATSQVASAIPKIAGGFAAYYALPGVANLINDKLQSTNATSYSFSHITRIKDFFSRETASESLRWAEHTAHTQGRNILGNLDYSSPENFWYSGLKHVEQTGLNLPLMDSVVSLFTKATYLSDVLSYSVKREGEYVLDVSRRSLGGLPRHNTLDLYASQLEIDRKQLDLIDYLVFENGSVFEGHLSAAGNITRKGNAINKQKARLVDKGKFTEGLLTVIDEKMGVKDPFTGGTIAETIGGKENYVLLSDGVIDKKLQNIFDLQGKIPYLKGKPRISSNKALILESYATMALHRTSALFSEMFNEVGSFAEYLFPNAKKEVFSFAYRNNLTPKMTHGHAGAMLGRYSALGMSVGLGLMALNQVGYSVQNGNAITKPLAGLVQTAGLAYVGALIGSRFKKKGPGALIGAGVGTGLGILGFAGIGPFANGPIPGAANLYARLNEIRSYTTEALQINRYKRSIEEMMPGATKTTTALGMGVLLGASYVTLSRFLNKDKVVEKVDREAYLRHYFDGDHNQRLKHFKDSLHEKTGRIRQIHKLHNELSINAREANIAARDLEIAQIRHGGKPSGQWDGYRPEGMNEDKVARIEREFNSYFNSLERKGEHGILNNRISKTNTREAFKDLAGTLTDFVDSEFRSTLLRNEKSIIKRLSKAIEYAPRSKAIGYASLIAATAWWLGTGGPGTVEKPHELRELNQGKRLEAVRRSQKWEMGQGGYEGDDILFYRPTLTARLSSGAVQKGSTGNHGPVSEFLLKNFTYKLERENYWKRPAPITGAAFDQVPFIYPFIQPFTDLIKSPKLMHVGEWAKTDNAGNPMYLERSDGLDEIPDANLGAAGLPAPYSPYASKRVLGRFWEQATDLGGLVGYFGRTAKLFLTGDKGFANQRQQLESFSQNADIVSKFYDLHGGGSFLGIPLTSEPIRRFLKKDDLKRYNPIRNTMPNWMPDNMKYGNPYTSIRHGGGEYRAPGEGYEALHPELKGLDPEAYPLLHQLNVLGDLAPYSSEYKEASRDAAMMRAQGDMTANELSWYAKHKKQIKQRKEKRAYDNYQFKPSSLQTLSGTISSVDPESLSFTMKEYGGRFSIAGIDNSSENLISDYNLSIKEAAKLRLKNQKTFKSFIQPNMGVTVEVPASIGQAVDQDGIIKASVRNNLFSVNQDIRERGSFSKDDSAISSYAMTNPVGRFVGRMWEAATHNANKLAQPIEHLLMFGAAPVNKFLPFRDALEDYQSREVYGTEMKGWEDPIGGWIAPALKSAAHNWLGFNFQSPGLREKRDTEEYFDKLKYLKYSQLGLAAQSQGNTGLQEQYANVATHTNIGSSGWTNKDNISNALGGRESAFALGFANEYNPHRQEEILNELPDYKRHIMEGYYLNADLMAINRAASAASMSTTGMDYAADLMLKKANQGFEEDENPEGQRSNEIERYFRHKSLPAINWVGFNPAVDLEDVKMKYIQSEGMDYHDFGMFPSRAGYLSRKSYITNETVEGLNETTFFNSLERLAKTNHTNNAFGAFNYNIGSPGSTSNRIDINYREEIPLNPFEE